MKLYVPAARFCKAEEAVDHFFQLLRPVRYNIHIIPDCIAQLFFPDQFKIPHHGCQRRLQVMRYICNEIYSQLITSGDFFQTFLLDLKGNIKPAPVKILHLLHHIIELSPLKSLQYRFC